MTMEGKWNQAASVLANMSSRADRGLELVVADEARRLEEIWVNGITSGRFNLRPNEPLTVTAKGSSKPLVNQGDMVGGIRAYKVGRFAWFTGILKNATSKYHKPLVDIAMVMEYGARVTPVRANALAIPMTKRASRAGSPLKYHFKPLMWVPPKGDDPKSAGVLVHKTKSAMKRKGKRRYHVAYVLRYEVNIPPRPHRMMARLAWMKTAKKSIGSTFGNFMKRQG